MFFPADSHQEVRKGAIGGGVDKGYAYLRTTEPLQTWPLLLGACYPAP